MASPISRRPGGLLDLLLTQQQGRNPSTLLDTVSPVLDLKELYETDRLQTDQNVLTAVAVGTQVIRSVPSGDVWKVYGWSLRGTFATVNQTINVELRTASIPGGDLFTVANFEFAAVGATDEFSQGLLLPTPIVFPPGTQFVTRCTHINLDAQANIGVVATMLLVQLNV